MTLTVEKTGRRHYITGNTYSIKDQLRSAGCKWDPDRKAWWTGKADVAAQFAGKTIEPKDDKPGDDSRLLGKAEYKGRTYYVLATTRDGQKHKLTVLNGSIVFWAAADQCKWLKSYQPRERTYGYGRHTRTEYTTLGSIRRFVERMKRDDPEGVGRDLEDGYYMRDGVILTSGCGECRRLGHMCRTCQHDFE